MRRGKAKNFLGGLAILLVVALIAAFYIWRTSGKGDEPSVVSGTGETTQDTSSGPSGSPSQQTGHITVYLDGWSYVTLERTPATFTADYNGAKPENVTWSPMNAADIKNLSKTNPDLVARVASRLVTSDKDLSCNQDKCTSGEGDISFDQIADPARLEGLGAVYSAYEVTNGLWKADLQLPAGATTGKLGAKGWQDYSLTLTSKENVAQDAESESEAPVAPSAENGYLQASYPIGAALGRFFINAPAWLGKEPATFVRSPGSDIEVSAQEVKDMYKEPLFAKGLANPEDASAGLSDSQLTYMSSPTTGCGVGVLCIPGLSDTKFEDYQTDAVQVCSSATGVKAVALIENSYWTFDLQGKTTMNGLWNGKSAKDFATKGTSAVYTGVPPLVDGTQRIRSNSIRLFGSFNGKVEEFTQAGHVAQEGFDSKESLNRVFDVSTLKDAFKGEFSPC